MCHDRQFENTGLTPFQLPLLSPELEKWDMNMEENEKRDWDKHKEGVGGDAKNRTKGRIGMRRDQKGKNGKCETSWDRAHSGLTDFCLRRCAQAPQSSWPHLGKSLPCQLSWPKPSQCVCSSEDFLICQPHLKLLWELSENVLSAAQGPGPQKDLECTG